MKLYFLTGLPTETDEDTLGIAELARNCVAIGQRHTSRRRSPPASAASSPSRTRRSSGSARTRLDELRRKIDLLRDGAPAKGVHVSSGTTRRPPWPRASPAEATGASAPSSSGCGGRAARSRSGASTSTCGRWDDAMAAEGLSLDWYVHRHRTEDEVLPWDHLTAGLHEDFLWADWQAALPPAASRTAGGRPATTAACAPATASSTSWRLPSPPAGGSQGTGQDLGARPPAVAAVRAGPLGAGTFTSEPPVAAEGRACG